jgi:drug/metabolite transporter (DMT)-like permease
MDLLTRAARRAPRAAAMPDPLRGIFCMLAAVALFAGMDAVIKLLSPRFPVMEIVFFRSVFAFLPIALMVRREGGLAMLRTRRPLDHAKRSLFGVLSLVCFVYAFGRMPLAEVVAIGYAAPLFITTLSVPLLGEAVGWRRWSAVAVGFAGVLVMVRPGAGVFAPAALVALVATLFYAFAMIAIRTLGRSESTGCIAFYFTLACLVAGGVFMPFQWVAPRAADWPALAALGLLGGFAQLLITAAFRAAPAALVAPFDYTSMLHVTILGWLFWGEMPDAPVFAGAAIVVASGLYILRREQLLARRVTATP